MKRSLEVVVYIGFLSMDVGFNDAYYIYSFLLEGLTWS